MLERQVVSLDSELVRAIERARAEGFGGVHPSWFSRLLDCETGLKEWHRAWHRIACINWRTHREYGQPYYANNPDKTTGGAL